MQTRGSGDRWFLLLLAIAFLVMLWSGLKTGTMILTRTSVTRAGNPVLFWASMAITAAGAGIFLALVFLPA